MCLSVPPNIIHSDTTQTHTIREGEDVMLTCRAEGFPEPKIKWVRTNGLSLPIPGSPYSYQVSWNASQYISVVLLHGPIVNVSPSDQGRNNLNAVWKSLLTLLAGTGKYQKILNVCVQVSAPFQCQTIFTFLYCMPVYMSMMNLPFIYLMT